MSDGLKDQWGVGAPAKAGSDQQSQQFQAAFQKELAAINEHLQYTAVNAEEARHQPLAARRDALTPAFQATLAKIDPAEPAKAKGIIDKVMADTKALNAEVTKFRKEAEKAFNDWQARQAKFDTAVHQVEELETWEDPKAQALRTLVDGIRKQVNEKKYAPASATVDQLLPKLKPIYDEYVRQKDAKEKYEPALEALKPRLDATESSTYAKLVPTQKDITSIKGQMEAAAQAKNYVQALKLIGDLSAKVDDYHGKLDELEKQKKAYEDASAALQPRLTEASCTAYPKLAHQREEIAAGKDQVVTAAQKEDFENALNLLKGISTKLDAYATAVDELKKQKEAYEAALTTLQPQLTRASECRYPSLVQLQEDLAKGQSEMETVAQNEDYDQALKLIDNLKSNVEAYLNEVKKLEQAEREFKDADTAQSARLEKFKAVERPSPPMTAKTSEAETALQQGRTKADGKDPIGALEQLKTVREALDAGEKLEKDPQRAKFLAARKTVEGEIGPPLEPPFPELQNDWSAIVKLPGESDHAADSGDYAGANKLLAQIKPKLADFKKKHEELKKKAGMKKVNVTINVYNWRGAPMIGCQGLVEFKSPGVPTVSLGGEISGGVVMFPGVSLMPEGALRIIAVARGGAANATIAPSGLTSYSIKGASMTFEARQGVRSGKVSAKSTKEAAEKVGAKGTIGIDYKIVTVGGEISGESEEKKGEETAIEMDVTAGTDAFALSQK